MTCLSPKSPDWGKRLLYVGTSSSHAGCHGQLDIKSVKVVPCKLFLHDFLYSIIQKRFWRQLFDKFDSQACCPDCVQTAAVCLEAHHPEAGTAMIMLYWAVMQDIMMRWQSRLLLQVMQQQVT